MRISVRDASINAAWQPDAHKRLYIQWLTSFLHVPYEWGGHWYGGRADENYDVTNTDDGYDGYGCDCSGLVSAGARWAGYNWSPWRVTTAGLAGSYYSTEIGEPNDNLQPGDILNWAGHRVVTIYRFTPGHIAIDDSHLIEEAGDSNCCFVRENVNIRDDYLENGFVARELAWHGD